MPYSAATVGNKFLDLARADGYPLTPMQIQKLVYFAHAWHLAYGAGPLISEPAQAWQWGPVFPSMYHAVKVWGGGPILSSIPQPEYARRGFTPLPPTMPGSAPSIPSGDHFANQLVERVWHVYRGMSGIQLSTLAHEPNGAWERARTVSGGAHNMDIPDNWIHDNFKAKLDANAARA